MGDSAKKILFVNAEMYPYLPETPISKICRELPQGIQERRREIRAFMPRYGCINERKNIRDDDVHSGKADNLMEEPAP